MKKPYLVKVPVVIDADSPEDAIALAEAQYRHRPKKARLAPWADFPLSLRAAAQTFEIDDGVPLRYGVLSGHVWASNGYWAVRVPEMTEGEIVGKPLPMEKVIGEQLSGAKAVEPVRFRAHAEMGGNAYDARFVDAIESLCPGCEWRVAGHLRGAIAVVGGEPVGAVMPRRDRPTEELCAREILDAEFDLKWADDALGKADQIRDAVTKVDAAEKKAEKARAAAFELRRLADMKSTLDGAEAQRAAALKKIEDAKAELARMGVKP